MSHDDGVCIIGDHENGVFQRFSLADTRYFCVSEADDTCAEPVGGSLKTEAGSCRRLIEERCDHLSFEQLAVRMPLEFPSHPDEVEQLVTVQSLDIHKVMLFHILFVMFWFFPFVKVRINFLSIKAWKRKYPSAVKKYPFILLIH